jgi:hypothetical protein
MCRGEEIRPEPIEEDEKMRTTIAKGCLYCGLRLPDSADFCPECGRPVEKGCIPHVTQELDADCLDAEIERVNDLIGQSEASSGGNDPFADETICIRDGHACASAITMEGSTDYRVLTGKGPR